MPQQHLLHTKQAFSYDTLQKDLVAKSPGEPQGYTDSEITEPVRRNPARA